jgi:hypothetical protein
VCYIMSSWVACHAWGLSQTLLVPRPPPMPQPAPPSASEWGFGLEPTQPTEALSSIGRGERPCPAFSTLHVEPCGAVNSRLLVELPSHRRSKYMRPLKWFMGSYLIGALPGGEGTKEGPLWSGSILMSGIHMREHPHQVVMRLWFKEDRHVCCRTLWVRVGPSWRPDMAGSSPT